MTTPSEGPPSSTDGTGENEVRRRRSTQYDDDDRTYSDSADGVRAGTHDVQPQPPADETHRVRFSAEVDKRQRPQTLAKAKKRKSDEMLRDTGSSSTSAGGRPTTPNLTIDTRAATIMAGGSVSDVVTSPRSAGSTSMRSPLTAGSGRNTSPVSARSRNRGLSLRSSLFARNMRTAASGGSIIEMSPVGSEPMSNTRPQSAGKKTTESSVTVLPVAEDEPPLPYPGTSHSPSPRKTIRSNSALPNYQQWVQRQANRHLPVRRINSWYSQARKFALRIQEIPPSKDGRHIQLDSSRKEALIDPRVGRPYPNNLIRSSRYTPYNFVPRQLFAQFSKIANFYFLIVSSLQMVPGLSTTGTYTTIVPLLFFVSISMAKEGYEDLRRHRLDKEENNREAKVLHTYKPVMDSATDKYEDAEGGIPDGPIHWASVKWQALQVGDIVKLERDEAAPADLVLLSSSGPNSVAFVETMALDGETNLKPKQPPATLVKAYKSTESIATGHRAEFVVEDPNLDLYNFEGRVTLDQAEAAPLTNNEIIYRGSVLRNTPEAIAIVVYSGEECKIRMNANKNPRIKAPSLQARVNKVVIVVVIFVLFLALFNTIAYRLWRSDTEYHLWYLRKAVVPFGHILVSFLIM